MGSALKIMEFEGRKLILTLLGILIGILFLALRLITILAQTLMKLFYVKKRTESPKCLLDPELGEHKYMIVNGAQKIHYVESGDASKPLILFVHGFPEFWWTWRSQIKHFNKKYHVVAMDMRGYNESGKPAGANAYSMKNLVGDIKGLVEGLNVSKFTLVAHDWGAAISWTFAAMHPDMLDRLVILNGPYPPAMEKVFYSNKLQLLKSWYICYFQCPFLPELLCLANDIEMLELTLKEASLGQDEEAVEAWKYAFKDYTTWNSTINYYRATTHNEAKEFFEHPRFQSNISVKTLQIHGTGDAYLSVDTAKESQKYVTDGRLELLEGISHWVQNQAPQRVNMLIQQFLEENND